MTVCNVNQVEASFLDALDIFGDIEKTDALIKQFFTGSNETLTEDDKEITKKVNEMIEGYSSYPIHAFSRQQCRDMFISAEFRGKTITWKEMPRDRFFESYGLGSTHTVSRKNMNLAVY